jgi:prepilin-type N-terminal cleavage/methylation domain-containing protein
MSHRKNQSGFTLVEIAIVLVIIGLLLGGVLKGQELIYNQKVKSTYDYYRQYTAAMYGYQDRYKAIPGDDPLAATRGFIRPAGDPVITPGDGNGIIANGGSLCVLANATLEVCQATYHLRLSGFLTGDGTIAAQHPLGGVVTLNAPTVAMGFPAAFLGAPTSICWETLPNKAAQQIDVSYDDGKATSGSMQGSANYTNLVAGAPNTPSALWTCMTN